MIKIITCPSITDRLPLELIVACHQVEELFKSLEADIDQMPMVTFDPVYTKPINLTSVDIVGISFEHDINVSIKLYTQNWMAHKFAPVNAYVDPSDPHTIYFNTRAFSSKKSIACYKETIIHELTHILDQYSPYSFGHGDNRLAGKGNTAPVKLSQLLATMKYESVPSDMLVW